RRRHTRFDCDWSSDVCSSDLLPANAKGPVPIFLVPNFNGNHAVHADAGITLSKQWMRPGPGVIDNKATEKTRGSEAGRFAIDDKIGRASCRERGETAGVAVG